MAPEPVAQFLGAWGYPAYAAALLATAFGSPITEDLLVLTAGYLISADIFSWRVAAPLSYAGVVATDSIIFAFGRMLRLRSMNRRGWLRRLVRPAQLRLATRWFSRWGDGVVFFARLVPGTRLLVFATAGVRGMRYRRFLVMDGLASLIYVPVLLWIGALVGEHVGRVDRALAWVGDRVLWATLGVAALFVLRRAWRRRVRRYVEREVGGRPPTFQGRPPASH